MVSAQINLCITVQLGNRTGSPRDPYVRRTALEPGTEACSAVNVYLPVAPMTYSIVVVTP